MDRLERFLDLVVLGEYVDWHQALTDLRSELVRDGCTDQESDHVIYSLCAFVDARQLSETSLEQHFFDSDYAGDEVYRRIDGLGSDHALAASAYRWILLLGFRGRFFGEAYNSDALRPYVSRLNSLAPTAPAQLEGSAASAASPTLRRPITFDDRSSIPVLPITAALLLLLVVVAGVIWWVNRPAPSIGWDDVLAGDDCGRLTLDRSAGLSIVRGLVSSQAQLNEVEKSAAALDANTRVEVEVASFALCRSVSHLAEAVGGIDWAGEQLTVSTMGEQFERCDTMPLEASSNGASMYAYIFYLDTQGNIMRVWPSTDRQLRPSTPLKQRNSGLVVFEPFGVEALLLIGTSRPWQGAPPLDQVRSVEEVSNMLDSAEDATLAIDVFSTSDGSGQC